MAVTKNVRKLSSDSANELLSTDIAERDAQGRKIIDTYATKGEIPSALPADGGNADYAATAGNASKCNNHTLGCDVPANADFTNTWPNAYIASISKSGNTLTITTNTGSVITFTNTTYSNATTSSAGLMSASDKTKLNGIESGAEKNKIKEIQLNGTTIAPDANGVVNILSSGGGTQKYRHHCTFEWSGGSGSSRYDGSLSFFFDDTNPSSYYDEDFGQSEILAFIREHCNMPNNKNTRLKVSGGGTVGVDSSYRHTETWLVTSLQNNFGSWYCDALHYDKVSNFSNFDLKYYMGAYPNFMPWNGYAVLYDNVEAL